MSVSPMRVVKTRQSISPGVVLGGSRMRAGRPLPVEIRLLGLTRDLLGVSAVTLGLEPRTPELAERFAWWGRIAFEAFA